MEYGRNQAMQQGQEAKREPEIHRAMSVLSDRIELLGQRTENLEVRLVGVLTPTPATTSGSSGPGAIRQYQTPLANGIADQIERIERIIDRLATLADRVEV